MKRIDDASDGDRPGVRWSPSKMAEFLRLLAATHSVSAAARAVGMSRQSAYKLRSRLKGTAFDAAWDEAFSQSYGNLPYAALDRALNGYEVPHYYKGELIGTSRRYDERLTVALLKMSGSPNVLVVGGDPGLIEPRAPRFEALLAAVEADGEKALVTPSDAFSRANPADLSPAADAAIRAEMRAFRRAGAG